MNIKEKMCINLIANIISISIHYIIFLIYAICLSLVSLPINLLRSIKTIICINPKWDILKKIILLIFTLMFYTVIYTIYVVAASLSIFVIVPLYISDDFTRQYNNLCETVYNTLIHDIFNSLRDYLVTDSIRNINALKCIFGLIVSILHSVLSPTLFIISSILKMFIILCMNTFCIIFSMNVLNIFIYIINICLLCMLLIGSIVIFLILSIFYPIHFMIKYIETQNLILTFKVLLNDTYKFDEKVSHMFSNFIISDTMRNNFLRIVKPLKFFNFTVDVEQILPNNNENNFVFNNINEFRNNIGTEITTWDKFIDFCVESLEECITKQLCSYDDLESYEPYLFCGVPAYGIIKMIDTSKEFKYLIFNDTKINTNSFFGTNSLVNDLYNLKKDIKNMNINSIELTYLEKWLFTCGNEIKVDKKNISDNRLIEINRLSSKFQSVAINISKLPSFTRRLENGIKRIIENKNNIQIVDIIEV